MFTTCKMNSVAYYVSDIDQSEAFYRGTLGLEIMRMPGEEGEDDWLMGTTVNDITLVFFKNEVKPGNSPMIVFELAEGGIDDVVAGLADKGVTIVTPVSHAPGGWTADIADPDGHVISLYQEEAQPRGR